ncbi:hypothetical protein pb186bvf_000866 [Paramecium bursaria]
MSEYFMPKKHIKSIIINTLSFQLIYSQENYSKKLMMRFQNHFIFLYSSLQQSQNKEFVNLRMRELIKQSSYFIQSFSLLLSFVGQIHSNPQKMLYNIVGNRNRDIFIKYIDLIQGQCIYNYINKKIFNKYLE